MARLPRLELSPAAAAAILGTPDPNVRVEFLRPENHTWRLTHGGQAYFLKAHTKDWYGGSAEGAANTVRHELAGPAVLRAAGVASARVVGSSTDRDNPLGWPYLLTRELDGRSLVDLLPGLDPSEVAGALRAIGEHLRARQNRTFEYPAICSTSMARHIHPIRIPGCTGSADSSVSSCTPATRSPTTGRTASRSRRSTVWREFSSAECRA